MAPAPGIKKSSSSDTLNSNETDSGSSNKDTSITEDAIPPMPIRKMKDLNDADLSDQELKFQKSGEEKKKDGEEKKAELVGFKSTSDKVGDKPEPVLTKEELKNRELEKVKKDYEEKAKNGEVEKDEEHDSMSLSSGGMSLSSEAVSLSSGVSSGVSSSKLTDEKNAASRSQLTSLTEDLKEAGSDLPTPTHSVRSEVRKV